MFKRGHSMRKKVRTDAFGKGHQVNMNQQIRVFSLSMIFMLHQVGCKGWNDISGSLGGISLNIPETSNFGVKVEMLPLRPSTGSGFYGALSTPGSDHRQLGVMDRS